MVLYAFSLSIPYIIRYSEFNVSLIVYLNYGLIRVGTHMKTKINKQSPIKKLIIPALVFIALAGVTYAYALSNNFFAADTQNEQSIQPSSVNNPVPDGPNPTNDNKETLGEETVPPVAGDRSVTITTASVNSNTLQIRVLIQGVVSGGTCDLSVVQNDAVVLTESVEVQPGPSSSTCKGFDVSVVNLPVGNLSVSVSYKDNGVSSKSAVRTVELGR